MSFEELKLNRLSTIASIFALALFVLTTVAVAPPIATASNAYTPTTLSLGGSTLIAPLMSTWQTGFNTWTGSVVSVNYQAVGSTTGTNDMLGDIFSIGFSDAPIPANGLATLNAQNDVVTPANSPPVTGLAGADPLIQVIDGLAPVSIMYNIPGYRGNLNLTGAIICQIYLLQITSWTNPHILAINPGLTAAQITLLGKYPIQVVHRSDGSGTSFALTTYFGRVDGNWTADGYIAGSTSASNFPAGELSAKGTGGVAGLVAATNGAIGYGETSYANGAGLVYAAVQNSNGNFVLPLPAGATAAAAADASILQTNPEYTIVDAPGAASYPISTFTYAFVWENQNLGSSGGGTWTQGTAYDAVQFLYYIVTQGQSNAATLLYAPLPASTISLDLSLIAQINYGGVSFIPSTTSTATCKLSTVIVGKTDKCNVALTGGSTPTGQFLWSSTSTGTFSHPTCKVPASGKCKSSFTGTIASPSATITSLYTGDLNNAPSISAVSIAVTQATTTTALSCSKGSVATGLTDVCKAVITGYLPTGTVTFSQTAGTGSVTGPGSCLLTQLGKSTTTAQCSITLTGATTGPVTLKASYSGSTNDASSTSKTKTVNVT